MKPIVPLLLFLIFILCGCAAHELQQFQQIATADNPSKKISEIMEKRGRQYAQNPDLFMADLQSLKKRIAKYEKIIQSIWGKKDSKAPGTKRYVKYTDKYYSRAQIDFEKGVVVIETVAPNSQKERLRSAVVTTLLTPDDPRLVDLYSDSVPEITSTPFLYKQVLDHNGKPIKSKQQAKRYTDHLLKTKLQQVKLGSQNGLRVVFSLVKDHRKLRAYKYADIVRKYSAKYNIPESLTYAVIDTESSFNPFAVSSVPAYGLMQIVPSTAGRDVFEKVKHKKGQPSSQYLFDPERNIEMGTAYLDLLQSRYLKNLTNKVSRRHAVVSAYNGGAGNVYKTFSKKQASAIKAINKLQPKQVYQILIKKHPHSETRNYLVKVTKKEKEFHGNN